MKKIRIVASIFILTMVFLPFVSYSAAKAQQGVKELRTNVVSPDLVGDGNVAPTQVQAKTMNANQGEVKAVQLKQNIGEGQNLENATGAKQQVKAGAENGSRAGARRSQTANAVQAMLRVAERNGGVGEQIRTVAQNQEKNQNQMEDQMDEVKTRGKLKKFFFGPDYKNLNSVEEKLANHDEKLNELKALALELTDEGDITILEDQIEVMEQIGDELTAEVLAETKGFSLFGWLNKMFSK